MNRLSTLFLLLLTVTLTSVPLVSDARVRADNYVRSGNQYLVAGPDLKPEDYPALSTFDLLVLPAEAQNFNPDAARALRALNPDIIILAYVPTVSYNNQYWNDELHLNLKRTLGSHMELTVNGSQGSIWPGTSAYNIANQSYRDAWLNYVEAHVWSSGYWDGIFFDEVSSTINWLGAVDLNRDGTPESAGEVNRAWRDGYVDLFSRARQRLGSDALLITNGSSENAFQPYVNGRMFESFPTPWEGNGTWQHIMRLLFNNAERNQDPDVFFINGNTGDSGSVDYSQFRYGLTSALLGGAFFGYDFGETSHAQLWLFDEYDVFLGRVVDTPKDELNPQNTAINPSVWSREFQQGKILVNATDQTHTIQLGNDFEKITGEQDPGVNDGRIVSEITIGPLDGIVLMRPVEEKLKAQFSNGSFARIFDTDGTRKRTGFFAYTGATLGGDHVVFYDFDGDGLDEIVTADDSQVRIHDSNGAVKYAFYPYTEAYRSGVNIAVGDFEGDGRAEIITGTERGGGPQIRIFNHEGVLIHPGFFAYSEAFRGGVQIALGDLNGDGMDEVIAGAGVGGGPHVRVFNKDGRLLNPGFFAYDENFRGGVHVAAGDVTGDGIVDIITGPGDGGPPLIRVFNDRGKQLINEFYAFDRNDRSGVDVLAQDLDGDDIADIMGLTTDVFTLSDN